jgi:hypothetical protein
MSLQITILKHKSKYYELSVCIILKEYQNSNISLFSLPDRFKEDLAEIPKKSTGTADMFYKAILSDDFRKCEIWHLTSIGDHDRKIAEITDDGKISNPFNF